MTASRHRKHAYWTSASAFWRTCKLTRQKTRRRGCFGLWSTCTTWPRGGAAPVRMCFSVNRRCLDGHSISRRSLSMRLIVDWFRSRPRLKVSLARPHRAAYVVHSLDFFLRLYSAMRFCFWRIDSVCIMVVLWLPAVWTTDLVAPQGSDEVSEGMDAFLWHIGWFQNFKYYASTRYVASLKLVKNQDMSQSVYLLGINAGYSPNSTIIDDVLSVNWFCMPLARPWADHVIF